MKRKKLPLGISDFKDIVTGNYYYVDKTLFIQDIIDKGSKVLLIPRPRRFGKTLNLSMVKYFYDSCPEKVSLNSEGLYPSNKNDLPKNSYKELFRNLKINSVEEEYAEKMGKHPVIFLSFRNIKDNDWETCLSKIKYLIKNEYLKHSYLLESQELKPVEKNFFNKIIKTKGDKGDYENSLEMLLIFLSRYYEARTVVLIDEYDAPIHSGFMNNYYDNVIDFMRNFLGGGLKDTDKYLEKGIITGSLRIATESVFSGFNNVSVFNLTSNEFNDKFGFTESEVETLLSAYSLIDRYDEIKEWYNGYRFGNETISNPWSIINFLENIEHEILPYWINTPKNDLIDSVIKNCDSELKKELEQLIEGESIEKIIDENIIMKEIDTQESFLWSFLLMSGYLKQTAKRMDPLIQKYRYTLSIPNLEVKSAFTSILNGKDVFVKEKQPI